MKLSKIRKNFRFGRSERIRDTGRFCFFFFSLFFYSIFFTFILFREQQKSGASREIKWDLMTLRCENCGKHKPWGDEDD